MSRSLPPKPSLEQLKKQAKELVKAQRAGEAGVCETLRLLGRFAKAEDEEILSAEIRLQEAQHALAIDYGFGSWAELKSHVEKLAPAEVRPEALERLSGTQFGESPIYLSQMVLGYVQALNCAGTKIDNAEFAAATGWAFSFSYRYDDFSPAFLALRGNPKADGPWEIFRFLPERLGYEYEGVPTAEKDRLWEFVRRHIDAGTPILAEQWDGGLFYGYRENDGKRELWFVWDHDGRWLDIEDLQPFEVCALVKKRAEMPRSQIWRESLKRAVRFASPHHIPWGDTQLPQGLAALEKYLEDVKDPTKDFAKTGEWFCWATFSRLCARKCCAAWLRTVADAFGGEIGGPLLAAAERYGRAGDLYDRYRIEVGAGKPTDVSLYDRARAPERIAVVAPILEEGIAEERAGLGELKDALRLLEAEKPW